MKSTLSLFSAAAALLVLTASVFAPVAVFAQTDLDAFMKKVIARRDDSWKKLQQYTLDQRDVIELRGPGQLPVWGEKREYTWFLRDGFFVRSPMSVNGVSISDTDRKKAEADYTRREKERDKRERERAMRVVPPGGSVDVAPMGAASPATMDGLIAQTRAPEFISSSYFLKYKFEEGKYALVGREKIDGHDVLKIEYYPARLFSDATDRNKRRADRGDATNRSQQFDQALEQAANKVSMVTLWIEPTASQIVKYTFTNVNLDFLPAAGLVRLNDVNATMQMTQPFLGIKASDANPTPDVWLPKNLNMFASMMIAMGQFDMKVSMDYSNYKLAETSSRIK